MRNWTYVLISFGILFGVLIVSAQVPVVSPLDTDTLLEQTNLAFIQPRHFGGVPILDPRRLGPTLEEAFIPVRAVFDPLSSTSERVEAHVGGTFRDFVVLDILSLEPVLSKVQELRVVEAFENEALTVARFKIVLFSEPETLTLVVYLEKEENQWKITGLDPSTPN